MISFFILKRQSLEKYVDVRKFSSEGRRFYIDQKQYIRIHKRMTYLAISKRLRHRLLYWHAFFVVFTATELELLQAGVRVRDQRGATRVSSRPTMICASLRSHRCFLSFPICCDRRIPRVRHTFFERLSCLLEWNRKRLKRRSLICTRQTMDNIFICFAPDVNIKLTLIFLRANIFLCSECFILSMRMVSIIASIYSFVFFLAYGLVRSPFTLHIYLFFMSGDDGSTSIRSE